MKSIQEARRRKELELEQALDEVLQEKERQLRTVQKALMEALATVNRILEDGAEDTAREALAAAVQSQATPGESAEEHDGSNRSSQSTIAAMVGLGTGTSGKRFTELP